MESFYRELGLWGDIRERVVLSSLLCSTAPMDSRLTTRHIRQRKGQKKIVALTAYDYSTAYWLDEEVDLILVGDSLGMVFAGESTTLNVTLDQMVYHTQAVARAVRHAHVVADLPFLTYQISREKALLNAGRLLQEGRAQSVKLEGGREYAGLISKMVQIGIPVLGHLGLCPQRVHQLGGFYRQARSEEEQQKLIADAVALEDAGVFGLVLENIPDELSLRVTQRLTVPTIGIGAGVHCDGQILVVNDVLGTTPGKTPAFAKKYANLGQVIQKAVKAFANDVRHSDTPNTCTPAEGAPLPVDVHGDC